MNSLFSNLRNSYEKNWPEVHARFTGQATRFIYSDKPKLPDDVIPVFCYHELDKTSFESDLEFLARNDYRTIDAQGLADHLSGEKIAPPRSVVLTVDDGARSLFDVGLPLLQDYSMKVVAFVAPRLHREDQDVPSGPGQRLCTWRELLEMHESGCVDIQSHSYEHRYVPRWPEPIIVLGEDPSVVDRLRGPIQSIAEDFSAAKKTIEDRLSKTIRHLAFVKYVGSDEAIEIGKKCGYQSFFWGYLPRHDGNRPGQGTDRITRVDGWYLRRLPGTGRRPLGEIFRERFGSRLARSMYV
jgi:peptidoglycan/xylan/chitin deacetylase (PgdA/CDA1 family)